MKRGDGGGLRSPWLRMAMDLAVAAGGGASEGWCVAGIVGCEGGGGGGAGAGNLAASPRQVCQRCDCGTRNTRPICTGLQGIVDNCFSGN